MKVSFVVGGIKAEPKEIKIELKQEPVEITAKDVCDINKIKQERNDKEINVIKACKISYNPQEKQDIKKEYQNEESFENTFNAKETLLMNFTSDAEENQSSSESANEFVKLPIEPNWSALYRTSEYTIEEKDRPQIIRAPFTCVSQSEFTVLGFKQLRCNHCKDTTKLFSSIRTLRVHIRRLHRDQHTLYKCCYCPYTSKYNDNVMTMHIIQKHKNKNEIKFFECYTCGYKCKFKMQLARHIRSHMNIEELLLLEMAHRCQHCPKIYRLRKDLRDHIDLHHTEGQVKYRCKQCSIKFFTRSSLNHHVQKTHEAIDKLETLRCTKCDFRTNFKLTLTSHKYHHHRGQGKKNPFQCEKCAYQSSISSAFKLHQMTHKNLEDHEMKYQCNQCDYKTYRHYSLQIHRLNHLKPEEIQYFYCYYCNFKAKRKDNLKTHVLRHFKQEEVPFGCYLCDFSTKKRQILVDHISEHSNKNQQ